jgi:putative heme transporter
VAADERPTSESRRAGGLAPGADGYDQSVTNEHQPGRHDAPAALRVAAAWSWRILVVLLLAYIAVQILVRVQVVVLPVILALLLCTFLYPVVTLMNERLGVPRGLGAINVLLVTVVAFALGVYAVYQQVRDEAGSLADNVLAGVEDIEAWLVEGPLQIDQERIDQVVDQGQEALRGAFTGERAVTGATAAVEVIAGLLLTLVLVFFFLKDGEKMWAWAARRSGARARRHVDEVGGRAWWALGGYMRGQAIVAAVDAFFIGIGIIVLGIPFAVPLIALTFFAGFFPIVGAVTAGAITSLVALADRGLVVALIMLAIVIAVQQIESNVLEPVVMSKTVKMHPVVILVALGAGAAIAGLIGAFLAVPIAAAATAVGSYAWAYVGPHDQRRELNQREAEEKAPG